MEASAAATFYQSAGPVPDPCALIGCRSRIAAAAAASRRLPEKPGLFVRGLACGRRLPVPRERWGVRVGTCVVTGQSETTDKLEGAAPAEAR